MPIANTQTILKYLPYAMGSYGESAGAPGVQVGGAVVVPVTQFVKTAPEFQASLYRKSDGTYVVAIAGTNDLRDLTLADAALATQNAVSTLSYLFNATGSTWQAQMDDALKFTFEAFKQIRNEIATATGQTPTFDQLRGLIDVTGHSLGGALAEIVGKFFGIAGANIDGPGVSALTGASEFTGWKQVFQQEFSELKNDYTLSPQTFGAYAFTMVGVAGTHLSDIEVQKMPRAEAAEIAMFTAAAGAATLNWPALAASVLIATSTAAFHPSGVIIGDVESIAGFASPVPIGAPPSNLYTSFNLFAAPAIRVGSSQWLSNIQLGYQADTAEANVRAGLSPMGIAFDGVFRRAGGFSVSAARDAQTGRIFEVYQPVDAQGNAIGAPVRRDYVVDQSGAVAEIDSSGAARFAMRVTDVRTGEKVVAGIATVSSDGSVAWTLPNGRIDTFKVDAQTAVGILSGHSAGAAAAIRDASPIGRIFGGVDDGAATRGISAVPDQFMLMGDVPSPTLVDDNKIRYAIDTGPLAGWERTITIDSRSTEISSADIRAKMVFGNSFAEISLADVRLEVETRNLSTGQSVVVTKGYTDSQTGTTAFTQANYVSTGGTRALRNQILFDVDNAGRLTSGVFEGKFGARDARVVFDYEDNGTAHVIDFKFTGPQGFTVDPQFKAQLIAKLNAEHVSLETLASLDHAVENFSGSSTDTFSQAELNRFNQLQGIFDYGDPSVQNGSKTLADLTGPGSTFIDSLSLIRAIQSGQPLPIAASGLRLASGIDALINTPGQANLVLSGASAAASGILSIISLERSLQRGDALGALSAGGQALNFAADAYLKLAAEGLIDGAGNVAAAQLRDVLSGTTTQIFDDGSSLVTGFDATGGVLPYLNLAVSIRDGNPVGIASSVLAFIPGAQPIAFALQAFSLIEGLFGGGSGGGQLPDTYGNANLYFSGSALTPGITYNAYGSESAGPMLGSLLGQMNTVLANAQAANPNHPLGLIPMRMPND